jgi:hypothetical protein
MKLKKIQVGMFLSESCAQVKSGIKLETLLLAIARPSVLTESERAAVGSFQNALKNGYEIQLENSEFETFEKLNILEGFLGEGTLGQWFDFFFKGTSEEAVEKIKKDVESNIKTLVEYTKIKASIAELREKINNRGDGTHTLGNWLMVITPGLGLLGLIIKHIYKNIKFKDKRDDSLKALNIYADALYRHGKSKGWE